MKVESKGDDQRFQKGAQAYAAYLETPEGRLRSDLAFANLREFLPAVSADEPKFALDIGAGTGDAAIRLAKLGFRVIALDSSQAMLEWAADAAEKAGVADNVILQYGDAARLPELFPAGSFDVVVCHNLLEYVDDPALVLRGAAHALRDPSAILSIVLRNQAGEVLKAAIHSGNLEAAETNLDAEWAVESLYGGQARLFNPVRLQALINAEPLTPIATRGLRVLADYLPPRISRDPCYSQILELERKLGSRPEFAAIARYTHCLARRISSSASSSDDPGENIA